MEDSRSPKLEQKGPNNGLFLKIQSVVFPDIVRNYKKIYKKKLTLFIDRSRFVPERFRLFCDILLTNSTMYIFGAGCSNAD